MSAKKQRAAKGEPMGKVIHVNPVEHKSKAKPEVDSAVDVSGLMSFMQNKKQREVFSLDLHKLEKESVNDSGSSLVASATRGIRRNWIVISIALVTIAILLQVGLMFVPESRNAETKPVTPIASENTSSKPAPTSADATSPRLSDEELINLLQK